MSAALVPVITRAGLAGVRNAQGTGLKADIVAVAVGRGNPSGQSFVGYAPTGTETALVAEQARVPLLSGTEIGGAEGTGAIGFRILARVPAGATYPINEIGFILSDGTLLALWSDPAGPVAYATGLADVDLAFDLFLQALPAGALKITVTEPDVPDTTAVLAELLAGQGRMFCAVVDINARLLAAKL